LYYKQAVKPIVYQSQMKPVQVFENHAISLVFVTNAAANLVENILLPPKAVHTLFTLTVILNFTQKPLQAITVIYSAI
jgi:hypothetical protein